MNATNHSQQEHHSENRLLRLPQVLALIPVSKSTWWAGVRTGRFPKPFKLSSRVTVWKYTDIKNLIGGDYHE
jgi:predicted DNA-binding transcriptional regulator AlpA